MGMHRIVHRIVSWCCPLPRPAVGNPQSEAANGDASHCSSHCNLVCSTAAEARGGAVLTERVLSACRRGVSGGGAPHGRAGRARTQVRAARQLLHVRGPAGMRRVPGLP